MSDNLIILIPESPRYVPSEEAQRQAVALFQQLAPNADTVKTVTSEAVQFVDCGENFEHVACPECTKEIDLAWWQSRMDEDYDSGFQLKPFTLPCCGATRNLNDLKYEWPQGFSRFSVEAMNPGIPDLSADTMKEFEAILRCRVRKILRRL
jgi:hypothetical protein